MTAPAINGKIWKVEITEITAPILRGFEPGWYARVHRHGGTIEMHGPLEALWEMCSIIGGLDTGPPVMHAQDADCAVVGGTCTGCGVWHGAPCVVCGGRAFHREGCDTPVAAGLRQAVATDRADDTPAPSTRICVGCGHLLGPDEYHVHRE